MIVFKAGINETLIAYGSNGTNMVPDLWEQARVVKLMQGVLIQPPVVVRRYYTKMEKGNQSQCSLTSTHTPLLYGIG